MNLFWHQFRTDCRAQRWSLIVFIFLAISYPFLTFYIENNVRVSETRIVAKLILNGFLFCSALSPLIMNFISAPIVGSDAFLMTKPLSRSEVFWSKTCWVGCILCLCALSTYLSYQYLMFLPRQQLVMFLMTFALFVAVLFLLSVISAASSSLQQFFTYVGFGIGLFVGGIFIFGMISRYVNIITYSTVGDGHPGATAVSFFLIVGVISWALVVYYRQARVGVWMVLCSFLLIPFVLTVLWIPITPRTVAREVVLSASLIQSNESYNARSEGELVLWENVLIEGLKENQIFIPNYVNLSALSKEKTVNRDFSILNEGHAFRWLEGVVSSESLNKRIQSSFPTDVEWVGKEKRYRSNLQLPIGDTKVADLRMSFEGNVYELTRLTILPYQSDRKSALFGGGYARLTTENVPMLKIEITRPVRWLRGDHEEYRSEQVHSNVEDPYWIVLYHPASQSAILRKWGGSRKTDTIGVIRTDIASMDLTKSLVGVDLEGMSQEQWLAECEVHLFGLRPVGVYVSPELEQKNYHFKVDAKKLNELAERKKEINTSPKEEVVTLPTNPSHADVLKYLDTVMNQAPRRERFVRLKKELNDIPSAGLIELARHLPIYDDVDIRILDVLWNRDSEIPDDVIIEGVKRYESFAALCVKRKLGDQIIPFLVERMKERQPLNEKSASSMMNLAVRNAPTSELMNDLYWHFIHAGSAQGPIAGELSELPGFDFDSAIRQVWSDSARNTDRRNGLAPYALHLGDKEALRYTLLELRELRSEWHRNKVLTHLKASLEVDLPISKISTWAEQNFTQLTFDPDTQKYKLP